MIRPVLLALLCGLALRPSEETVAFRVAPDTTLARTFVSSYEMALDGMQILLNDEEIPAEAFGEISIEIDHSETYRILDALGDSSEGRPARLQRTFEEISGKEHARYASDEGEETDETDYESDLEEAAVLFVWNAEEGTYERSFVEGREGPAGLLEGLEEDLDLRSLLPSGPVSAGDRWDIGAKAFQGLLDPGGELGLHPAEVEDWEPSAVDAQLRDNLAGEFEATLLGTEELDGTRTARIGLRVDVHTSGEQELEAEAVPEGGRGTNRVETHFVLEGELRWDLANGHAQGLDLEGTSEVRMTESIQAELDGDSVEQVQTMVFKGAMRIALEIERR